MDDTTNNEQPPVSAWDFIDETQDPQPRWLPLPPVKIDGEHHPHPIDFAFSGVRVLRRARAFE